MAQGLAIAIFLIMFILIVTDKIERHYVTLGCGLLVLIFVFGLLMQSPAAALRTLNLKTIITPNFWIGSSEESSGINWATIIFIAGMMIMVEGMGKAGFFRWLCLTIAKAVKYKTVPLLITFMIMSSLLAMFIDSITVILFLAAVTVELSHLLRFNPVPMIISEIFCANLGGSATMCGDPPNIIIGTSLELSFFDFISNTGVIAFIGFIFTLIYFYLAFRKKITPTAECNPKDYPNPADAIESKRDFVVSSIIFAIAVVLLVTHSMTHLTVAFIGLFIAVITVLTNLHSIKEILGKVDYKTLLFFIGLFIVVGGLEETGVLKTIADFIGSVCGGNEMIMVAVVIFLSAFASAFVDNIPFAATMVPIIKELSVNSSGETNMALLAVLAWTLSIGADIGGSATPIGASANVVGTSVSAKTGHPIGWGTYCKYSAPATVIVVLLSLGVIYLRYFIL